MERVINYTISSNIHRHPFEDHYSSVHFNSDLKILLAPPYRERDVGFNVIDSSPRPIGSLLQPVNHAAVVQPHLRPTPQRDAVTIGSEILRTWPGQINGASSCNFYGWVIQTTPYNMVGQSRRGPIIRSR